MTLCYLTNSFLQCGEECLLFEGLGNSQSILPTALIHTIPLHLTGGETKAQSGLVTCLGCLAEKPEIELDLASLAPLVSGPCSQATQAAPKVSKACPASHVIL